MPKFSAQLISDLMTPERDAGRLARKVEYIVACEASDGSWCEFDAETLLHASLLADNAVDKLGARGCSVWQVRLTDGAVLRGSPLYTVFAGPQYQPAGGRTREEVRECFRDEKLDHTTAVALLIELGFTEFAADQYLFAE